MNKPNENIKEKAACENMSVEEGLIASLIDLRDTLRNGERLEELMGRFRVKILRLDVR